MEYTKQELESLLLAFKILEDHEYTNTRQSIGVLEEEIKELYVKLVMKELKK